MADDNIKQQVYDIIRGIRDPERPQTLEDLDIVDVDLIQVENLESKCPVIKIIWTPTVPQCSLALTVGLCMRVKLQREFSLPNAKIDILVKEGCHLNKNEIDKQVNDKERISAALENEGVLDVINELVADKY